MRNRTEIFLILLIYILSTIAILLSLLHLGGQQQFFVCAILALAFFIVALLSSFPEAIVKLKGGEGWQLAILGTIFWVVNLGVPYLILKNTSRFWANYLFWTILTFFVLFVGLRKISRWKV